MKTDLQYLRQDNYIWMYPNADAPKAVCSVRVIKSYAEDENGKSMILATPSVILGKSSVKSVMNLHRILNERYKCPDDEGKEYETTCFILSCMLFDVFLKLMPESMEAQCVNLLRLKRDNIPQDCSEEFFRKCMDIMTEDTEPLYSGTKTLPFEQNFCSTSVIYAVEDATVEIGIKAEQIAYNKCHSGVTFGAESLAEWGTHYSITDLFHMCAEAEDMQQAAAVILHEYDLGILNFETEYTKDGKYVFVNVRA